MSLPTVMYSLLSLLLYNATEIELLILFKHHYQIVFLGQRLFVLGVLVFVQSKQKEDEKFVSMKTLSENFLVW